MDKQKVEVAAVSGMDAISQDIGLISWAKIKGFCYFFVCFKSVWTGTFLTLATEYLGEVD